MFDPSEIAFLQANQPTDIDEFTDALMVAEGRSPEHCPEDRAIVRDVVESHFSNLAPRKLDQA